MISDVEFLTNTAGQPQPYVTTQQTVCELTQPSPSENTHRFVLLIIQMALFEIEAFKDTFMKSSIDIKPRKKYQLFSLIDTLNRFTLNRRI